MKKVTLKIVSLILVLALANVAYTLFLYPNDLELKSDKVLEAIQLEETRPDLIYLSDCSNTNTVEGDSCQQSVVEHLNTYFPKLKMISIDKSASHAGIFKWWLKHLNFSDWKPKVIVVTIGLRSFNSDWINSPLETPLRESVVLAQAYPNIINRFMLSLKAYDNTPDSIREKRVKFDWQHQTLDFPYETKYKCVKQWDSIQGNGSHLKPDGSWDMEKISLACHYVKGFAFTIKPDNPRLKDFDEIAAWAKNNKVKLCFHIIPENITYADSLVNKDLVFLMRRNVTFLQERYTDKNTLVLNNMEGLNTICFTEKNWTTEHYSCGGRKSLAKKLAQQLEVVLKK